MTDPIAFTVEGKPVAKDRPRAGKNGFYTPDKTREYEEAIQWSGKAAMDGRKPLQCAVTVAITAFVPIPGSWSKKQKDRAAAGIRRPTTRPDIDNYVKAALDGMNGIVYHDDNQVVGVSAVKYYSNYPRMEIVIQPLEDAT